MQDMSMPLQNFTLIILKILHNAGRFVNHSIETCFSTNKKSTKLKKMSNMLGIIMYSLISYVSDHTMSRTNVKARMLPSFVPKYIS